MIDANSQFFAILTNVGMAKQANADALGLPWKFTDMGVGDANNTDPIPGATQTQLINEWRRRPLNQVRVDPVNPAVIIAEQIIPSDEGGHWIREIGLYDADGDLVAVANCAPSFKPVLSQGSGRTQVVRMNFIVSSTGNITLKIDPAVVLATREYVDTRIMEELYKLDSKQSVRVATTVNIALAGLQVLDGVTLLAGDRVLVKNQTVAKDNGIYIAGAPAWVRAPDADTNAEVTSALLVSVEQGTALADTRWQLVTDGVIVLGTTALTFQNITQGFAPINSPALLGAPTAPTPPQFDNSTRIQTTASAKRMGVEYSGFAPLTASTVLGASSIGGVVAAASATPINMTLPTTAGVPEGATVEVVNAGSGAVTVLPSGLDVLASPVAGVINVVLGMGDNAEFIKVSGTWRLRGGSMALKYAAVMGGANWTTQPQFNNTKALATTEFVQRFGMMSGKVFQAVGTTSLALDMVGGTIEIIAGAPCMINPPLSSTVVQGSRIEFVNACPYPATIARQGADAIISSNGVVQSNGIVLQTGDSLTLMFLGGINWIAVGGTATQQFAPSLGVTAPQFDNTKALATVEFVQRALGNFKSTVQYNTSQTLTAAMVGQAIQAYGSSALTFTLPPIASPPDGGSYFVANGTDKLLTLKVSGTDPMFSGNSGIISTLAIPSGSSVTITRINGQWFVCGPGALFNDAQFASVLAASSASQQLPGLSIKTGNISNLSTAASIHLTFPVAFPVACVALILTGWSASNSSYTHNGRDRSGADIWRNANANYQLDYIAIGY